MIIKKILFTTTLLVIPFFVHAQNTNTTNINAAELHQQREASIEKLRENAKLLPLLLIPLAVGLYVVYRRYSD